METQTIITNIKHEELVNLFSTALYGSNYLGAAYPDGQYEDDDCFEDILAKALINHKAITITDYYAEGDVHGNLPHTIDSEENVSYEVRLEDIVNGLAKAANMYPKTFNAFANDTAEWDYFAADALLQVIVFGDLIYG